MRVTREIHRGQKYIAGLICCGRRRRDYAIILYCDDKNGGALSQPTSENELRIGSVGPVLGPAARTRGDGPETGTGGRVPPDKHHVPADGRLRRLLLRRLVEGFVLREPARLPRRRRANAVGKKYLLCAKSNCNSNSVLLLLLLALVTFDRTLIYYVGVDYDSKARNPDL